MQDSKAIIGGLPPSRAYTSRGFECRGRSRAHSIAQGRTRLTDEVIRAAPPAEPHFSAVLGGRGRSRPSRSRSRNKCTGGGWDGNAIVPRNADYPICSRARFIRERSIPRRLAPDGAEKILNLHFFPLVTAREPPPVSPDPSTSSLHRDAGPRRSADQTMGRARTLGGQAPSGFTARAPSVRVGEVRVTLHQFHLANLRANKRTR